MKFDNITLQSFVIEVLIWKQTQYVDTSLCGALKTQVYYCTPETEKEVMWHLYVDTSLI